MSGEISIVAKEIPNVKQEPLYLSPELPHERPYEQPAQSKNPVKCWKCWAARPNTCPNHCPERCWAKNVQCPEHCMNCRDGLCLFH